MTDDTTTDRIITDSKKPRTPDHRRELLVNEIRASLLFLETDALARVDFAIADEIDAGHTIPAEPALEQRIEALEQHLLENRAIISAIIADVNRIAGPDGPKLGVIWDDDTPIGERR